MKNDVLVLGARGMVGHTVYNYLSEKISGHVFGTDRNRSKNSSFFVLRAENISEDLKLIFLKLPNIEYVINCIGALKGNPRDELFQINYEFPLKLSKICQKYNVKLIHVSTDAVFPSLSGKVTEKDTPDPKNDYGKSKLQGEPQTKNCINFRTSFIGLDPKNHKGLLEWVMRSKNHAIPGYVNQIWKGCTTLQFAKLCEDIILNNKFTVLRKRSPAFHFAPLGPITKYELIHKLIQLIGIKRTLLEQNGEIVNRELKSLYFDFLFDKKYTTNVKKALKELLTFEFKI